MYKNGKYKKYKTNTDKRPSKIYNSFFKNSLSLKIKQELKDMKKMHSGKLKHLLEKVGNNILISVKSENDEARIKYFIIAENNKITVVVRFSEIEEYVLSAKIVKYTNTNIVLSITN